MCVKVNLNAVYPFNVLSKIQGKNVCASTIYTSLLLILNRHNIFNH